jgi:hypothetical protein
MVYFVGHRRWVLRRQTQRGQGTAGKLQGDSKGGGGGGETPHGGAKGEAENTACDQHHKQE